MKQTVTLYDFRRAFETLRPDNFSYEGLGALFEALEDLEEGIEEEIELDVIAICCDFAEYTLEELNSEYDQEFEDMDEALEYFSDETWVIPVNDEIMIMQTF